MAVVKSLNDCDLIITVANGVDKDGNIKKDVHRFSKIKTKVNDEELFKVGKAILNVMEQSGEYSSIDKAEGFNLLSEQ